jgi:hypothetical protein
MMKLLSSLALTIFLAASAFAAWTDWAQIPNGEAFGEPSVVVTQDGSIHVMVRGTDSALWWTHSKDGGKTWVGSKSSKVWTKVGGILTSPPSCMEPMPNIVECYVRNKDKGVSQIDRINNAWGQWADIGGVIMTNVSATAAADNVRTLYAINNKGTIARKGWWGSYGWHQWGNDDNEVGKTARIACSEEAGNSTQWYKESGPETDSACVVLNTANSTFSLIADANNKQIVIPALPKISSDYVSSVRLYSISTMLEVYFVGKDKQMRRGNYKFGTGWTGEFEVIGNGQFSSGPSCAGGPGKHKIATTCVGRGTDKAVWYSFSKSGTSSGANSTPPQPATSKISLGNVLFNAGPAGNDVDKMVKRPFGEAGKSWVLKPADAISCNQTRCKFNMGFVISRSDPSAAAPSIESKIWGAEKLPNGKPVIYADYLKFAPGKKLLAVAREIYLDLGQTTTVTFEIEYNLNGTKTTTAYTVDVVLKP